jgi:hypothetical protein
MKTLELPNQGAKKSLENKSSFMAIQILTLGKGINKWAQNGSTLLLKSRIIIFWISSNPCAARSWNVFKILFYFLNEFLGAKKSPLPDWSLESVIFNPRIWLAPEVLRKRTQDHAFWLDKISGTLVTYHPTLFGKRIYQILLFTFRNFYPGPHSIIYALANWT